MLINIASILLGLVVLIWSSDKFIEGAAAVAGHLKIQPLIIGLVILGFGTSAPEIMVSIFASLGGNPELALGNALGSNIANIALVLGITAIIATITIESSILKREFPLLIGATAIAGLLLMDLYLSRTDGILLIVLLVLVLGWMIVKGKQTKNDSLAEEISHEIPHISLSKAWGWTLLGLVFLVLSSKALVWGASNIASAFGVSDLVIGLTIVAIGTSLPELAASIMAARKNEHDMAIGNIIGSNLFNLLAVVGISGLIKPYAISSQALNRDFVIMALLTLFIYIITLFGKKEINRTHGIILFTIFVSYLSLLYFQNT